MGYRDIWPFRSRHGSTMTVYSAPMTAAQGFLAGEPIQIVDAGTVTAIHKDGNQWLLADVEGIFACGIPLNGPGTSPATAELPASQGWGRLWIHPDSGDTYANTAWPGMPTVGNPRIWYVPVNEGVEFITRIVIAAGGAAAGAGFTGADRGEQFQLTYCSGTTPDLGWGLERTAGVLGTDFVAQVTDVLDAQFRPVSTTGSGTFATFTINA